MDQEPSTPDALCEAEQSGDDVDEQARAEPSTFMRFINAEAGKQSDGLRVTARTLAYTARGCTDLDLRHAPGVVRDDARIIGLGDDEDLRGTACCRLEGVPLRLKMSGVNRAYEELMGIQKEVLRAFVEDADA